MTTNQKVADKVLNTADEATKQIQNISETLLATSKQTALASVEAYAKSVDTVLDFQLKFAGATGVAAVDDLVAAQVKLFGDLNAAGVSAARSVLA
ncbi:MAG: hypothetical protein WBA05_13400 [Gordonia sp. (in: high G+C Gram-positive bacteria)]|uniref:hypothetical protein n=1 Tax=Gordonia TaxID=2053 RepID=UPI003267A9AF